MKHLLLPLLAALALPTTVNAEISDRVHRRCKDAKDYSGCIEINKNQVSNKLNVADNYNKYPVPRYEDFERCCTRSHPGRFRVYPADRALGLLDNLHFLTASGQEDEGDPSSSDPRQALRRVTCTFAIRAQATPGRPKEMSAVRAQAAPRRAEK